ncbi:Ser-Thr-rich glycosyl-phosphatidyl-inositol-anchored membrane family-domain-containing protein [Thermothelomyces heterothallicus CBS 202.75]|uniref:Ser-Thr-rich glycosyl-phosphatidyl-inositol-anchored membrane family-domain-containing protein n=1 Tax=Thermothelomyces heterothallicus CBS 202.75 TaxID=1149848 RepID=UPI00374347CE
MRFSITALLALASAVVAQDPTEGFDPITKPAEGEKVPAGSTYDIVWLPSEVYPGDIKIALLGGSSPQTLTVVDTIAEGVDASTGTYSWSVPSTLGDLATYGIIVTLESDPSIFQYGFPFKIVSGDDSNGGSSSNSSATVTSTSTTASSSSATSSSTGHASTATSTTSDAETTSSTTQSNTKTHSSTVTSTSFTVPSSTLVSSTIRTNTSFTISAPPLTTITSSVIVANPTSTTSSTSTIATNGVPSLAAGSFALFGGVAMAVLAL